MFRDDATHLPISSRVSIPLSEIAFEAIRASGPGGQNVNKVSSAVQLRFDIGASSLPDFYKERLLARSDQRITREGVIVIKSQEHRSQELNREAGLARLQALVREAGVVQKARRPTKPSRSSQRKRVDAKKKHGRNKVLRKKPQL